MSDISIEIAQLGSYNPNARESVTNIYHHGGPTRMGTYFKQLHKEIENKTTRAIIDDLLYYKTKLDGTKGMEEKLRDGGFGDSFIRKALIKKQQYAKKTLLYDCYPSAQEIDLLIYADILNAFMVYVEPLINREAPIEEILERIHTMVVTPIMSKINTDGAEDCDLHYTSDHIYGMIYYLTGRCHINWKNYDNV